MTEQTGITERDSFSFRLTRRQAEIIIAEVAGVQCSCEHHAEMNRIATRLQAVLDAQGRPKSRAEREATAFVDGFGRAVSDPL